MNGPILYLCGPMTGLPDNNRPAFRSAERELQDAGYSLVNPIHNGVPSDAPWLAHMRKDIADMVSTCDAVATLSGVEASRGSIAEIGLATALGWPVHTVDQWLDFARTAREAEALMD